MGQQAIITALTPIGLTPQGVGGRGVGGVGGFTGISTENATILISLESFLVTTASANAALDFLFVTRALRNCLKSRFPSSSVPTWIPGKSSLSTKGLFGSSCTLPPSDVTLTL